MYDPKIGHRLIIAGDLFPTGENVSYFAKGDIASLFGEEIVRLFDGADFSVCNLEGSLTDHSERCRKTGPVKVAPTAALAAYKGLGIQCCMLANNHSTDGGNQGMADTLQALDAAGIGHIGAGLNSQSVGHSLVQMVGDVRFGFYNVSETMYNKPTEYSAGAWLYDAYLGCRELAELRRECDYLVVIYHGGIEKFPYPSPEMRKRFHRMADSGADMILAQHTHCIGCEEMYNGSYLLYGQGDFLLKNYLPGVTDTGLLLELDVLDGPVTIKKHWVRSVDNLFVRLDEHPDLPGFAERSEKVKDEAYVLSQFKEFCAGELRLYLTAFKNPTGWWRRLQRKFFPRAYDKWLCGYTERNLLFTLHTLRSEQNRETAIVGLENKL